MYKKITTTFLIFLTPITIIEQDKNRFPQLNIKKVNMNTKNNFNVVELLFNSNEKNIANLTKNLFITFKR